MNERIDWMREQQTWTIMKGLVNIIIAFVAVQLQTTGTRLASILQRLLASEAMHRWGVIIITTKKTREEKKEKKKRKRY